MNKRTVSLTDQQYIDIITAIKGGFCLADREYKPNERIATALTLEANLGVRIGDVVKLRFCDIIRDGDRFRLDISEQKTDKARTFTVPAEIRAFIDQYRINNHMCEKQRLFDISERQIQKHLAELIHFTDEQLALADTNGDGEINISDATHLQKYLAEFDGIVLGKQPTA